MYILNKNTIVFLYEMNIIILVRCESGSQEKQVKCYMKQCRLYIERSVITMKKANFFEMLYGAQYDYLRGNSLKARFNHKAK